MALVAFLGLAAAIDLDIVDIAQRSATTHVKVSGMRDDDVQPSGGAATCGAATGENVNDYTNLGAMRMNGWSVYSCVNDNTCMTSGGTGGNAGDSYLWRGNGHAGLCNPHHAYYCGFGWSHQVGVLSRRLQGSGTFTLRYGNGWTAGHVYVYLNGVQIDTATANQGDKTLTHAFSNNDLLSITEGSPAAAGDCSDCSLTLVRDLSFQCTSSGSGSSVSMTNPNHLAITTAARDGCVTGKVAGRTALTGGESCFSVTSVAAAGSAAAAETACEAKYEQKTRSTHRVGQEVPGVTGVDHGTAAPTESHSASYDLVGEVHLCEWRNETTSCEAGRVFTVCPEDDHVVETAAAAGGTGNSPRTCTWGPEQAGLYCEASWPGSGPPGQGEQTLAQCQALCEADPTCQHINIAFGFGASFSNCVLSAGCATYGSTSSDWKLYAATCT